MIETVKPLIGRRTIQSAQLFIIMTDLEIVQQPVKRSECRYVVISAVETGFQPVFADEQLCFALFVGISAFPHKADAGNEALVLFNQLIKIGDQRLSHILLQILRVAPMATVDAV